MAGESVWKDENTGVDSRYIENLKPTPPGIVKQEEVLSVVRHQNPPTHRSLIFEVHFQELEVYFVKNKGLPMLFLAQCGQMTI